MSSHDSTTGLNNNFFKIQNRRYIGAKHKLIDWIFSIIEKECKGETFVDLFAGTGVVSSAASRYFKKIIINDFLYSNYISYQAFFGKGKKDDSLLLSFIKKYNALNSKNISENYFSKKFGNKYFTKDTSKIIGYIRDNIEKNKSKITEREYFILITSLMYTIDKIANTVGHYDAYLKKDKKSDSFQMKLIDPIYVKDVSIYKEDSNILVKKIKGDIVYIDPPYNSRQYSRFYHLLETLVKWDKPELYGVAMKPMPENMSDYCRISAKDKFSELINDIDAKYIVVSYNNTYESKSSSSKNKITLKQIEKILSDKGKTKIFKKNYRHFNTGNTKFNDHKEYVFVTKIKHAKRN